ncbi:hypothetical protein ACEZCY_14255 [Streptacidiphilus sp. N1-12]|uniref:Uncharacterized protein n=2 Tax=Streptacidiphilus alkalitolerans TaxID=3342712 RepID=A0ABV6WEC5_9ACTN
MLAAAARAAHQRLGGRGYALLGAGSAYVMYGVGIIQDHRPAVNKAAVVLTHAFPLTYWGVLWIVCGGVALICAPRRAGHDVAGFGLAALPPGLWAAAYVIASVTGRYPRAWTGAPAWLLIPELLAVVAVLSTQLLTARRRVADLEARITQIPGGVHG